VIARPGLTKRGLARRLDDELEAEAVERAIDALVRKAWAAWAEREQRETQARARFVRLSVPLERALELAPRSATRQRSLLEALERAGGEVELAALIAEQGASSRGSVDRLVEAGVLQIEERERRDAFSEDAPLGAARPPVLNDDQRVALEALTHPGARGTFLLHGVTGAGKTEVFLGAASAALERGRQVLVLVPEIGLTPQLVGRFKARFGDAVAVLHSGLTGVERLAAWRRIRAGEAGVAVGARSALFAPFRDLGLLVVDEEHDDSYKQDEGVAYHARDLAVVLGQRHQAAVVLASATPSMESWFNARQGRYQLLSLPRRATARPVPTVEVVDLSQLPPGPDGKRPLLAPEAHAALAETFAAGGQAIVLYNRRGYATCVECAGCGGTYECPNCKIAMTLHRRAGIVACHYCALKLPYNGRCPSCGKDGLEELGKGTERVEETLAALFPDVPQGRMDADTTAVRGAHHRILQAFREGQTRLLVGTQIVAKGHDFPGVHTAVVISADHGLRMPDFRSAERTWSLLVQMAGRAGRGEVPGRVLVQTWAPDHYVLKSLGDTSDFYDLEARHRAALRYPPFSRLCLVRLDGVDRRAVSEESARLARELRDLGRPFEGVELLGPAQAALPRLVGRWRFQLILRGREIRAFRGWLSACRPLLEAGARQGVRLSWDVDPRHLL
jgi:primosomal protein N' (replication factor Y)